MLHDEDAEGHGEWLAAVKGGAPARHPLLPLVWDEQRARGGDGGGRGDGGSGGGRDMAL